jgi:hypothetical protein
MSNLERVAQYSGVFQEVVKKLEYNSAKVSTWQNIEVESLYSVAHFFTYFCHQILSCIRLPHWFLLLFLLTITFQTCYHRILTCSIHLTHSQEVSFHSSWNVSFLFVSLNVFVPWDQTILEIQEKNYEAGHWYKNDLLFILFMIT